MQVDVGEFRDDEVEKLGVVQPDDLLVEGEALHHLVHAGGEMRDVALEVASDVGGVVEQPAKVERRGVVDVEPTRRSAEDRVEVGDSAGVLLVGGEDGGLGGFEHAVEAAEDDERQDHPAVLGLLIVAAEEVGDRPDEGDAVLGAGHGVGRWWRAPGLGWAGRAPSTSAFILIACRCPSSRGGVWHVADGVAAEVSAAGRVESLVGALSPSREGSTVAFSSTVPRAPAALIHATAFHPEHKFGRRACDPVQVPHSRSRSSTHG